MGQNSLQDIMVDVGSRPPSQIQEQASNPPPQCTEKASDEENLHPSETKTIRSCGLERRASAGSSRASERIAIQLGDHTTFDHLATSSEIEEWVRSEHSPWLQFLEEEEELSCRDPSSRRSKLDSVDTAGGIFTLLRNRKTQHVALCLSLFYFGVFCTALVFLFRETGVRGRFFQIDVDSFARSNIADVGLILAKSDCEVRERLPYSANNSFVHEFATQVSVSAWFVGSNTTDANIVPSATFRIWWAAEPGSPLQTFSCDSNFPAGFECMFARGNTWSVPLRGQERTQIDTLPCMPCAMAATAIWFALSAGCGLTSVLALLGRRLTARIVAGVSVGALTLLCWLFLLAQLQRTGGQLSAPLWRGAVTSTLLAPHAVFNLWQREFFATVLFATSAHLALLCLALAQDASLGRAHGLLLALRAHEAGVCVGCLMLVGARIIRKNQAYRRVFESVQEAKDRLDQVWLSTLLALGDEAPAALADLSDAVAKCSRNTTRKPIQRMPHPPDATIDTPGPSGRARDVWDTGLMMFGRLPQGGDDARAGPTVQSLEQLYAQARCCSKLLRERVQALAESCRGMLPLTPMKKSKYEESAPYVLWEEAKDDAEIRTSVQWTPLKPLPQAESKVLDHYHGEVCRLLDVCRETLVFQDVADITVCISDLMADKEIVVERMKNTLTAEQPSEHPRGFRGVLVNLRVDSPVARGLGVSGHICELLLLPLAVACCLSCDDMLGFQRLRRAGDARVRTTLHQWRKLLRWGQARTAGTDPHAPSMAWDLPQGSSAVMAALNGGGFRSASASTAGVSNNHISLTGLDTVSSPGPMSVTGMSSPFTSLARPGSATNNNNTINNNNNNNSAVLIRRRSGSLEVPFRDTIIPLRTTATAMPNESVVSEGVETTRGSTTRGSIQQRRNQLQQRVLGRRMPVEQEVAAGSEMAGGVGFPAVVEESMVMRMQNVEGVNIFRAMIMIDEAGPLPDAQQPPGSGPGAPDPDPASRAPRVSTTGSSDSEGCPTFFDLTKTFVTSRPPPCSLRIEGDSAPSADESPRPLAGRAGRSRSPRRNSTDALQFESLPLSLVGCPTVDEDHVSRTSSCETAESRQGRSPVRCRIESAQTLVRNGSDRSAARGTSSGFEASTSADPGTSSQLENARGSVVGRPSRMQEWKAFFQAKATLMPLMSRFSVRRPTPAPEREREAEVEWGRGKGVWYLTLEKHFRQKVFGLRQNFESKDTIEAAVTDTDYLNVFHTSYPIQAAQCKAWFRILAVVMCIAQLIAASLAISRMLGARHIKAQRVRFVSLEQRGGPHQWQTAVVGAMGVQRFNDSCLHELTPEIEHTSAETQWVIRMDEVSHIEGFFWRTSQGPAEQDPVRFKIQVSVDGEEWQLAASSHRLLQIGGIQEWGTDDRYKTPEERGAIVKIDFKPPWFLWLDAVFTNIVQAATWFGISVCALGHRKRIGERLLEANGGGIDQWLVAGRNIFILGFMANAVCVLIGIGAMVRFEDGFTQNLFKHSCHALVACILAFCSAFYQRRVVEALLCYLTITFAVLMLPVKNGFGVRHRFEQGFPYLVEMFCLLQLLVQHARLKRISQLKVAEDMAGYERVWEDVVADEDEALGIKRLCQVEARIYDSFPIRAALQVQRFRPMTRSVQMDDLHKSRKQSRQAKSLKQMQRSRIKPKLSVFSFPTPSPAATPSGRTLASGIPGTRFRARGGESVAASDRDSGASSPRGAAADTEACARRKAARLDVMVRSASPCNTERPDLRTAQGPESSASESEIMSWRLTPQIMRAAASLEEVENGDGLEEDSFGSGGFSGHSHNAARARAGSEPVMKACSGEPENVAGLRSGSSGIATHLNSRQKGSPVGRCRLIAPDIQDLTSSWKLNQESSCAGSSLPLTKVGRSTASLSHDAHGEGSQTRSMQPRYSSAGNSDRWSVESDSKSRERRPFSIIMSHRKGDGPRPGRQGSAMAMFSMVASSLSHRLASASSQILGANHAAKASRGTDGELVESLDQLYAQAEILHPLLKKKVQRWAAMSEGCFPLKASAGKFAEWQFLVDRHGSEEGAEEQVKWATVKDLGRAKEKLVRSYDGRPSKLLDVCRQSIVFKSTVSVAECLRTIAEDPDVVMVSIKNRLRQHYPARARTLGYRDVNLSVRFDSAKTRQLGVDLHICEVQLLLEPFAKLKSADGHKRYIAWRNCQAR